MNPAACAIAAARSTSSAFAPESSAMFSRIDVANRKLSWKTIDAELRSDPGSASRRSTPPSPHRPLGRIVETNEQLGEHRLAGPRHPDDGHRLVGLHVERHALEDPRAADGIRQRVDPDIERTVRERHGRHRRLDPDGMFQDSLDPIVGHHRTG